LKEDMDAARALRAAPAGPPAQVGPAIPPSFEALFRREYARVVGIALRIVRDADEAEDVAQDVFISFYRKHPADAGYAPAWLHAAAAHTALNWVRSRERRGKRETVHARESDRTVDPQGAAETSETRTEVRSALARMDERAASLLALRYSGLSYDEIAAALGLRKSSIGTLLGRAEDAFKREVTR
jgi:RNA polymerase sigma factor (sigma-70 family)